MDKRFKRRKKKTHPSVHTEEASALIEKLKDEDEFVSFHNDPDGKIIFLNETITPNWLIEKLNNHFICDRNEGVKGLWPTV
ncbi:MAG: hypothetical protein PHY93_03280 [Bacteriovorax sp.]|nr:hypothetical protein [Bacteriovorax sp.]